MINQHFKEKTNSLEGNRRGSKSKYFVYYVSQLSPPPPYRYAPGPSAKELQYTVVLEGWQKMIGEDVFTGRHNRPVSLGLGGGGVDKSKEEPPDFLLKNIWFYRFSECYKRKVHGTLHL